MTRSSKCERDTGPRTISTHYATGSHRVRASNEDGIEDSKPWLTLLKAGDCILALPHCALNSPTFVGELEHHLESLNPEKKASF